MNSLTEFDYITIPPFLEEFEYVNINISQNGIINERLSWFLQLIFFVVLSAVVSVLGIVANIINIIVFVKQRAYKECGSVNLLGLAVSDLFTVTTMLYVSFCYSFIFTNPPNLPWEPFDLMFVTGGWTHLMFAQITRTITAYIALERCICVVFPFKVKTLLTPKRSIIIIVCIFICFLLSFSPAFIKQQLRFQLDPFTNRTRLKLVLSPDWQYVVDVMWYINSITFNVGSVVIVLVSTLITATRVQLSTTWRKSMATGNSNLSKTTLESKPDGNETTKQPPQQMTSMSNSKIQKEKKLIFMIILISIIFLICYIPDLTFLIMYSINPGIRLLGKYHNFASVMYALTFFMETLNSSINIVVYYKMSSRYKQVFRQVMGFSKGNE